MSTMTIAPVGAPTTVQRPPKPLHVIVQQALGMVRDVNSRYDTLRDTYEFVEGANSPALWDSWNEVRASTQRLESAQQTVLATYASEGVTAEDREAAELGLSLYRAQVRAL